MSSVFESAAASAYGSAFQSPRPAPALWGAVRALATWLGLVMKSTARPKTAISAEQKKWLRDKQAMLVAGNEMLGRCRRDNQPLSVVVFSVDNLPQLKSVFGRDVARQFVSKALARLSGMATEKGLAARTGATVFTVLLPGLGHDRAVALVHETLGNPCRIELNAGENDAVLVPVFMVKTVNKETASIEDVYQAMRRNISQARCNHHLRQNNPARAPASDPQLKAQLPAGESGKSQEVGRAASYSADATIPMPLTAIRREWKLGAESTQPEGADSGAYCTVAATIPMPIGRR